MTTNETLKIDFPNLIFPNTGYQTIPTTHATDNLYNSGRIYEEDLLKLLNEPADKSPIIFKDTPRWSELDFIAETDKTNIFIELKGRNLKMNAFKTTYIIESKIKYFRLINNLNPSKQNRLYLVFAFIPYDNNSNIKDYYYIKYTPSIFKSFTRKIVFNKSNIEIPIECLKPISDFKDEIIKY
jgi:Holliday junction resolvase-like predicted endonuclease